MNVIGSMIITLREGLEAALIVGIVLSYLGQFEHKAAIRYAWIGVLGAVVASILLAVGIQSVGAELEGKSEEIFEGTTMLLAAGMLTWMIFWMRTHAKTLKLELESQLKDASNKRYYQAVAGVTFLAVFREGVETALFLSAATFATNAIATLIGALIGLSLAVLVGYVIFTSAQRFNLRLFFNITSVLLLIFAAMMLVSGIHEFQEAGVIDSLLSNEILEQGILYLLYAAVIASGLWWYEQRRIPVETD